MDFRGSKVIILDSSSDIIRGIHGLDELLRPPAYVRRPLSNIRVLPAQTFAVRRPKLTC